MTAVESSSTRRAPRGDFKALGVATSHCMEADSVSSSKVTLGRLPTGRFDDSGCGRSMSNLRYPIVAHYGSLVELEPMRLPLARQRAARAQARSGLAA
jgi:hypothetical protein